MDQLPQTANGYNVFHGRWNRRALALLPAVAFPAAAALADSVTDWQLRRLFAPTEAQLQEEHDGRIFIYDGLPDWVTRRALDEQFDRVDYMMFINAIVTDGAGAPLRDSETGQIVEEEDGC